jgi:hypothetical protein
MNVLSRTRPLALAAGPAAVGALALFFAALAVHGDDVRALSRGALGVGANALALLSLLLLLVGLARLATRPVLHEDGLGAVLIAATGTVLVAGGAWAQLVLLPVLAVEAPDVAEGGATLLTAGYITSFLVFGVGWLLVGLRLRKDGVPSGLLMAGAVLAIAPLPTRWFLLAVAVSVLAVREQRDPVPARALDPSYGA